MISYREIVTAIKQLPTEERLALLEELAHSLVDDIQPQEATSSVTRVRGMLRSNSPMPSEVELRESYSDYLIQKYS